MSASAPVPWSEWQHGGPYRPPTEDEDIYAAQNPAGSWQPAPAVKYGGPGMVSRELRILEGTHYVVVSVVETASPSRGWEPVCRMLLNYHVPRDDFLADPPAALSAALGVLVKPLVEAGPGRVSASA